MLASLIQQQPRGNPGPKIIPVAELGPRVLADDDDAVAVLLSLLDPRS